MYKLYYLTLAICLSLFGSVYLANYFYLKHSGEIASVDEVIDIQVDLAKEGKHTIVGFISSDADLTYKVKSYQKLRPDLVMIGSSRVMEFKEYFFKPSFYNTGGASRSVNDLEQVVDILLKAKVPKAAVIGVEECWFVDDSSGGRTPYVPKEHASGTPLNLHKLKGPSRLLENGKLSLADYVDTVFSGDLLAKSSHPRIGVRARQAHSGFAPDGSWLYTNLAVGLTQSPDKQFAASLAAIAKGEAHYTHSDIINPEKMIQFIDVIAKLESKGVEVYLFFPPYAPTAYRAIKGQHEKMRYNRGIREVFDEVDLPYFDFNDPVTINASDCEFVDGIHGGELVYAKIVNAMAKNEQFRPLVDEQKISELLNTYDGITVFPDRRVDPKMRKEVDFLDIGCAKPVSPDVMSVSAYLQRSVKGNSDNKNLRVNQEDEKQALTKQVFELIRKGGAIDLIKLDRLLVSHPFLYNVQVVGVTPLMVASRETRSMAFVRVLLKGAVIDEVNSSGTTALHMVAHDGFPEIALLLVDNGASLSVKDVTGHDAISYARLKGHRPLVIQLQEKQRLTFEDLGWFGWLVVNLV